jgi:hypothetical protein
MKYEGPNGLQRRRVGTARKGAPLPTLQGHRLDQRGDVAQLVDRPDLLG